MSQLNSLFKFSKQTFLTPASKKGAFVGEPYDPGAIA